MACVRWTPEEDEWMREHYPHHSLSKLEGMHAERFPNGPHRTNKAIGSRAKVLRVVKDEGYVSKPPTFWTPDKRAWFIAFVPGHEECEISAEHERLYGTPLTENQIGNAKVKFGVKSGTHGGRFKEGHASPNKGRTWDEIGHSPEKQAKMRSTCFKKGNMPHNCEALPVGVERVNRDGYVMVKVAMRKSHEGCNDNWKAKHRMVYEQNHGSIPEGCQIVFADGDKRNFDPDNLIAVPRGVWSTIKRLGFQYGDAESLQTAMALARLAQVRNETRSRAQKARKENKRK